MIAQREVVVDKSRLEEQCPVVMFTGVMRRAASCRLNVGRKRLIQRINWANPSRCGMEAMKHDCCAAHSMPRQDIGWISRGRSNGVVRMPWRLTGAVGKSCHVGRHLSTFGRPWRAVSGSIGNRTSIEGVPGDLKAGQVREAATIEIAADDVTQAKDDAATTTSVATQRVLQMLYTCNQCDTKNAAKFSASSYETGSIVVRCEGCQSLHLLVDHLKFFDAMETFDVETLMAERGRRVVRLSDVLKRTERVGQALAAGDVGEDVQEELAEVAYEQGRVAQYNDQLHASHVPAPDESRPSAPGSGT